MKKHLFHYASVLFAILCITTFSSCRKSLLPEAPKVETVDVSTLNMALEWLSMQKDSLKEEANRQTIDAVKLNLVASQIRKEGLGNGKHLVVIPLKDDFKTKNTTVQKTFKAIVFFENENNTLQSGRIVEIIPNQKIESLPANLISNVFNKADAEYDGFVSILSITNHFKGEIEYKNKKLSKVKLLKPQSINGLVNKSASANRTEKCIDWYWEYYVGGVLIAESYAYTTCSGEEPCQAYRIIGDGKSNSKIDCSGGGGNDEQTEEAGTYDRSDDGKLSCRSFTYNKMTSNMYEAGVKGLQFVMDIAGGGSLPPFNFRTMYIGFPSKTATGKTYTPGQAAAITAAAMNNAGQTMTITYFGMSTAQASLVTKEQLEAEFMGLVQFYINRGINAGSTISFRPSGADTTTNEAVWNSSLEQFWNGLSGSDCK